MGSETINDGLVSVRTLSIGEDGGVLADAPSYALAVAINAGTGSVVTNNGTASAVAEAHSNPDFSYGSAQADARGILAGTDTPAANAGTVDVTAIATGQTGAAMALGMGLDFNSGSNTGTVRVTGYSSGTESSSATVRGCRRDQRRHEQQRSGAAASAAT